MASAVEKATYRVGIRSFVDLTLPDFAVIGAPRSGTTWLHENLARHPEIFLATSDKAPDRTEVVYFDTFFEEPLTFYSAHFEGAAERAKGDKSPNYLFISARRIRYVHRMMPGLRLIVMLRDPIDRAWSHARMRLGPQTANLTEAERLPLYKAYFEQFAHRGCYSIALDRWLAVFPGEQLFIGFFEQIASEPQALLRDLFDHIGVGEPPDWNELPYRTRINAARSEQIPPAVQRMLARIYREEIDELADRFGDRVAAW